MKTLKSLLLAAAALGVAVTTAGPAFAGGGYGHGYHGSKFHGSKFRGGKFRGGKVGYRGPRYRSRGYYRGGRGYYGGRRYYRGRGFGPGDAALIAGGIIGGAILLDQIEADKRYRERRAYEAGVRRGERNRNYDLEREYALDRAREREFARRDDLGRDDVERGRPGFGDEDIPSELLEAERRKLDEERAALEAERRALREARRRQEPRAGLGRGDLGDDFDDEADEAFEGMPFDGSGYGARERNRSRDDDFDRRDINPSPIRPVPEDDAAARDRNDPLDDELLGGDEVIRIAYRGCTAETRARAGQDRMIAALPSEPSNIRKISGGVYHMTADFMVQDPRGGQYKRLMSCKADSRGVMQLEII